MRIVVTGSTGLVGSALSDRLLEEGHDVIRLTRTPSTAAGTIILWDPDASEIINHGRLEGMDAVIHLAGENIASSRWAPEKKASIRNSRVQGTGLLARTLATLHDKPKVLISASATGYYGDRGNEVVTEESAMGHGFLSSICRDWEEATQLARDAGIRCVHTRIGVVLSTEGGALSKMLPPFRAGIGGRIGSGRQWMSWITLDDVVNAMIFCMNHEALRGPVNFVSPNPATNADFSKALGKALGRPAVLPVPAFAIRAILGGMADELLLTSTRAAPEKLQDAGFSFAHPELPEALEHVLKDEREA